MLLERPLSLGAAAVAASQLLPMVPVLAEGAPGVSCRGVVLGEVAAATACYLGAAIAAALEDPLRRTLERMAWGLAACVAALAGLGAFETGCRWGLLAAAVPPLAFFIGTWRER